MYTVDEIAAQLKVSRSTVYNAIDRGELPHHRIGRGRGTIRVSQEQLERYLEGTKVEGTRAEVYASTPIRLRDIQYRGT